MDKRQQIRRQIRSQRQALPQAERQQAAIRLCSQLDRSRLFNNSRHIAFYLANDGEIDPYFLMHAAWQRGKQCYLPVLGMRPCNRLWFIPYAAETPLVDNRFGIPEPIHPHRQRQLKPHSLDLILMPLVAFDQSGNRLGMGGGFYDRTLAFLQQRRSWRKPRLVGLAYEFQERADIPVQQWDVPLDAIVTEQHIYLV